MNLSNSPGRPACPSRASSWSSKATFPHKPWNGGSRQRMLLKAVGGPRCASGVPADRLLQDRIGYLLKRPLGCQPIRQQAT